MEKFNPAGIFYDITRENHCFCEACSESMKKLGLNKDSHEDVEKFGKNSLSENH